MESDEARSGLSRAYRFVANHESTKPGTVGRLVVMHSIIWAALIVATALVLVATNAAGSFTSLLIVVFIPLWFVSDRLLRRAVAAAPGRD